MTTNQPPLSPALGLASNNSVARLAKHFADNRVRVGSGLGQGQGDSIHIRNPWMKTAPFRSLATHPWKLSGVISTSPSEARIYISPGLVNNFIPTADGTSLAAATPPYLVVTGSSGVIQLKATVDVSGSITALIVENVSSLSSDTSTNVYKLVGTWTSASGQFTSVVSILNANQTLYFCGGSAIWEA